MFKVANVLMDTRKFAAQCLARGTTPSNLGL